MAPTMVVDRRPRALYNEASRKNSQVKRGVERAIRALQHLPVGDSAAREHVQTVVVAFAELRRAGGDGELLELYRLFDALDIDSARVEELLDGARRAGDRTLQRRALRSLRAALEPPRELVFRHLAVAPGSPRLAIDLRAELLALRERHPELAAELALVDEDLRAFLAQRFDPTLLELRQLTWSDSAALLERLARSEAVHAVRGWFDLKDRLDVDRRCYAFFHPALPELPLVFTEVALTLELVTSIRTILDKDAAPVDPRAARSAIFYSISATEPGLTGVPLGNALIKRAVEKLKTELPKLRTFATLSPLPGFAAWVRGLGAEVAPEVRAALAVPGWQRDPAAVALLQQPLTRLAARYLVGAKRSDGTPRDAVARFHIGNGAILERIDWLADPTERGLKQSFGVMVNYRYALERVAANQLAYATDRTVETSPAVAALVREADPPPAAPPVDRVPALSGALRALADRARATSTTLRGAYGRLAGPRAPQSSRSRAGSPTR